MSENKPFTLEFGAQTTENASETVNPNDITPAAEPALSIESLTPEEQQAVKEFIEKIDISNSTAVMEYGAPAQNKIAQFSDSVLQSVRTKDTGEIGKSLTTLVNEIKSVEVAEEKGGFFKKAKNSVANFAKQIEKMSVNYAKVETNVDKIVASLNEHERVLLKDINILDGMYDSNLNFFKELSMYIIAGNEKLSKYNNEDIPAQRAVAEKSSSEMETQKLNDMVANANRFEKKLHDLKISRTISIQMAPQIRMIQNNDRALAEKIQSSIVNAIPLWKNQMVISMSLANSKAALSAQKKVTDLTNEMLVKNSEALKQGSIEIAAESERSIVSIETVRKTNENLITTISEVLAIQERGHQERVAAETELVKLEDDLKQVLLSTK